MHQKPPRQRNLRGKPRPFAVNRVFNHLHQQGLPLKQNVFNALVGFGVLPLFHNIHNVQKRRPLQAHVHKRALHSGQHAAHNAQINIAHQAMLAVALNMQLANIVLFQNRHARFLRRDVHQHRFGRARQILGQRVGFKSHCSFRIQKIEKCFAMTAGQCKSHGKTVFRLPQTRKLYAKISRYFLGLHLAMRRVDCLCSFCMNICFGVKSEPLESRATRPNLARTTH